MNTQPTAKDSGPGRALVIGAGIGGIAAAARLARTGYDVTVLEKNATPGGRCSQWVRDGHRFDIGPTLYLMPEIFEQTYADLGERLEDHLELRHVDPTYQIHFEDGTVITLSQDLNAMRDQLEAHEPGSFDALLRYLVEGGENYRLSVEEFVGRNFNNPFEYFNLQNLLLLIKLKPLAKHYEHLSHFFHDEHLQESFSFQNMYLGMSPFDAPATYSLLQYVEMAKGVWFPVGGMYRVTQSLVSIAEKNGVRFHYNTPVQQIEVENHHARGVTLEDGTRLEADLIVANADLPYVYRALLPPNGYNHHEAEHLENLEYTASAIMFYWGVDRVVPQLGMHNIFLAGDYRGSFERIFRDHTLPDAPSIYVHAPSRIDPTAAPEGQDTLMVLVPAGHLDEGYPQDWEALRARARSAVLGRLASIGVTDLEQHLKFELSVTPQEWARRYNLERGAAFGLSHNVTQVGYLRPHNRHDRYHNLYFTGSSTHPGTGVPMVLLSAKLTVERVLEDARHEEEDHLPPAVELRL